MKNALNSDSMDDISSEFQSDVSSCNKHWFDAENDVECDHCNHAVNGCFMDKNSWPFDGLGGDVGDGGDENYGYDNNGDVNDNDHDLVEVVYDKSVHVCRHDEDGGDGDDNDHYNHDDYGSDSYRSKYDDGSDDSEYAGNDDCSDANDDCNNHIDTDCDDYEDVVSLNDDRDLFTDSNECTKVTVKYSAHGKDAGERTDSDESTSGYFTCEYNNDNLISNHEDNIDDPFWNKDTRIETIYGNKERNVSTLFSSIQLIKCSDLCTARQYENVMNTLEEFQTQSKWEEHKCLTSYLQGNEINDDLKIVLFLEQGMAEIMQKHFSLGKKLFRQALRLCSQSENLCLLQGRALMFLGNAYRKEGPTKYGKAFKCLTLAEQNLCLVESKEDKAELNYFLGVLYLNLLSISIHEPSQKSRDRIEKHYQAVYDYAMAESASRVRDKIQKIFPLGMANFLLDGQTELARSRNVPETKLKKAEDCLKYFADRFPFDEQPVSVQTDYCKSMSDLEYRRGNLPISQEFLEKGLKIANSHGYHLEVQSLEKRLSMLEKCLPRVLVCLPQEDNANFADHSATADSEVNVFSSGSE